jgi:ADP-ribose pyrophosphatase YjhB (NUDIX family)
VTDPLRTPSFSRLVPQGDNRERNVCDGCGFVDYVNPRVVVGAVCVLGDELLLCRRAIEPRKGFWTMPSGFMEELESAEEGAAREAMEEAGAAIEVGPLLGVWSVPRISQVHLVFLARLASARVAAGDESLEVRFFRAEDIPWDALAFPSVTAALRYYLAVRGRSEFPAFVGPLGDRP